MLGSCTPRGLILSMLLLLSASSSGESRPHEAHEGPLSPAENQRVQLVEAVKTGILSSLGMDREPEPTRRASEQEMRRMFQLYREQLREMRGNTSQSMKEISMSTVLLPATVEPVKERQEPHQHVQWYRAVFHNSPSIQTELTLARAELKISRQVLSKPTSARPESRREFKVEVKLMKPVNSTAWTPPDALISANVSTTQDVMLDISPEVAKWIRTDDGRSLVVDVGMVVRDSEAPKENPAFSLELGFDQPKPARNGRFPRSNKEDDCSEQGWCCRKSVTVSFKDIGWSDWVVAPTEYMMHLCDGSCPHNYKPASMHTQVKSRLHQIMKGRTPQPCCVPASYEPLVLMHYDSRGQLKLTPFSDFIVSKCHCA